MSFFALREVLSLLWKKWPMRPETDTCIKHLTTLGHKFARTAGVLTGSLSTRDPDCKRLYEAAVRSREHNPWFTFPEISRSLNSLTCMLEPARLQRWVKAYPDLQHQKSQKLVAVIMAGNIPLVGFHDMLSVWLSGKTLQAKCSSQDAYLPLAVAEIVGNMHPWFKENTLFTDDFSEADAVIATGSDNTARYFSWHYGHLPHIIRRNRNSAAVLAGADSPADLHALGRDVFSCYGLGCRNVTHLMVPEGYAVETLAEAWQDYKYVADNKAYMNNIRYQRALHESTDTPYLDHGFFLMRNDRALASPVGVVHYSFYPNKASVQQFLQFHEHQLQCVVGPPALKIIKSDVVPFGMSQHPQPWDYADRTDTMDFLLNL